MLPSLREEVEVELWLSDLLIGLSGGGESIPILRRNLDLICSADDPDAGGDRETIFTLIDVVTLDSWALGGFDIAE